MEIRHAQPADYGRVVSRVNAWWGGREMAPMLPRLFFVHFEGTSYVVDGEDGQLAAFLIGFHSQSAADEAYIHFVGIAPERRGEGLGRRLYERFFEDALADGRTIVRCVTSPTQHRSQLPAALSLASCCKRSARRARATTRAPRCSNSIARARPIPLEAPVTIVRSPASERRVMARRRPRWPPASGSLLATLRLRQPVDERQNWFPLHAAGPDGAAADARE